MREAREELKRRIVHHVRNELNAYYLEHPDRLGDARGKEAQQVSFAGIEAILRIIDLYQVSAPDDLPALPPKTKTN
jgi:hypothetical protein